MKRFFVNECDNIRDIGGYCTDNNKTIKEGVILRSNLIRNLGENNMNTLKNQNFRTIIDLRSNQEVEDKKSIFSNDSFFDYHHIRINGDGAIPENKDKVVDSYIDMLEGKEQIKEIFEILEKTNSGVIYYCNAGKDRTGVVSALILKTLGVDIKDIAVDYIASGIFMKENIKSFANGDANLLETITPKGETIFKLFEYIDQQYGSLEAYLDSCQISQNTINNIRAKYIS